jgi:hypothetical protein
MGRILHGGASEKFAGLFLTNLVKLVNRTPVEYLMNPSCPKCATRVRGHQMPPPPPNAAAAAARPDVKRRFRSGRYFFPPSARMPPPSRRRRRRRHCTDE